MLNKKSSNRTKMVQRSHSDIAAGIIKYCLLYNLQDCPFYD